MPPFALRPIIPLESIQLPEITPFAPKIDVQRSLEEETRAPVTFVSKRTRAGGWLGDLRQTIQNGFRHLMTPVAATVLGASLLLSGCAMTGGAIRVDTPAVHASQRQGVDLARTQQILEARGDASQLATLLRGVPNAASIEWVVQNLDHPEQALEILEAKMADPKASAELASLGGILQVLKLVEMETHTKNAATPAIAVFIDRTVAEQTESGGKWDEDKNRAWTVSQLGPGGSLDMLLLCPVSGHAKDHYPDELYQRYTSHRTAPSNDYERMRANAQIYSNNNSQYIYLSDDPSSYGMGRIVVADVKAEGRYVTPVRVHLEGLEPGKTYEIRWSPFVGADPNHPTVDHRGFKNGRSFRLIIPAEAQIAVR